LDFALTEDQELIRSGVATLAKSFDDRYFYVEQETYAGTPLQAVQRDYAYLSKLTF